MRTTLFPLNTLKEIPNDAEIISHQLMLRAGMIRRVSAGLYTWTSLGLKVLRKVENIIREEMDNAGALEVLMPAVQPAELWEESGRWGQFGPELLRFKDRHQREYCMGPTHEEVITDFVRREVKSYKQLPLNYYQIQWKFRDETRPRFGVMRSREFLMKDAYSFHDTKASLVQTYAAMHNAYTAIFTRLGLKFRAVTADSGAIGGTGSQEFHVLAQSGEDAIAFSDGSLYAANIEMAEAIAVGTRQEPTQALAKIATPGIKSIDALCQGLKLDIKQTMKTLIVHGENDTLIAFCLRGDHDLNEIKAAKISGVLSPLSFADEAYIWQKYQLAVGSIGPVNLPLKVVMDRQAALMSDFACGANEKGFHLTGVNFERDLALANIEITDIRNLQEGDASPCGQGFIKIVRGIEVGHIFQLGNRYSSAMNATIINEDGQSVAMEMGCYGIGVTRIVAAAIEQNNDEKGIIWHAAMAPFALSIIPMNYAKSEQVRDCADKLYADLKAHGIDVLLEDRDIRAGAAFSDHELIGIPQRIVIGERSLKEGMLEYKGRTDAQSQLIALDKIVDFILNEIVAKKIGNTNA